MNERLGITFETNEVETIGRFVFSQLGREPEVDDQIDQQGYVLRADAIDNTGIERLVIQPPETSQTETGRDEQWARYCRK